MTSDTSSSLVTGLRGVRFGSAAAKWEEGGSIPWLGIRFGAIIIDSIASIDEYRIDFYRYIFTKDRYRLYRIANYRCTIDADRSLSLYFFEQGPSHSLRSDAIAHDIIDIIRSR